MLPFLVYIFLKKYNKQIREKTGLQIRKFLSFCFQLIFVGLLVLLLSLIPMLSGSQNLQLNYRIIRGGDHIGWMRLEKSIAGNTSTLLMVSEIKTRMIFQINVSAKETSFFESGKLIYSSQYRKTNGNTKVDKQTRFTDNKYQVLENGEKEDLDYHFIGTNLLSLYFHEPIGINFVYCDKHECFVGVAKTNDGGYKVKFPDGNSNVFYYSQDTCIKIRINHTFYSADIILNP
jgi:hypothetical protein